jgi:hypothetical protein
VAKFSQIMNMDMNIDMDTGMDSDTSQGHDMNKAIDVDCVHVHFHACVRLGSVFIFSLMCKIRYAYFNRQYFRCLYSTLAMGNFHR